MIEPLPTYVLLLGRGGSDGDAECVPCNSTLHVSKLHGAPVGSPPGRTD